MAYRWRITYVQTATWDLTRRRILICLLAITIILIPPDAWGTVVLFVVSRDRILIAADGLATQTIKGRSGATNRQQCKIGQVGTIFFAVIGLDDYPPTGLHIPILMRHSIRPDVDVLKNAYHFEELTNAKISETWKAIRKDDPNTYRLLKREGGPPLTILITGTVNGNLAIALMDYSDAPEGLRAKDPVVYDGIPLTQRNEIGEYRAIDEYKAAHPEVDYLEEVPWLEKLIEVEISQQPRTGWKAVGPPKSVLEITKSAAFWHDQGACPAIGSPSATTPASPPKKKIAS